jgi:hypothetical protein
MDPRAPKIKSERTLFENKENPSGKWHKEDKKKIGKSKTRPEDKVNIEQKIKAALKKLRK